MKDHTDAALKHARRLRREMTLPEVLLWQHLRKQPMGVKFRKQHPVGDYVVDFYCAAKRVAIEIDGKVHDHGDRPQRDDVRDARLRAMGLIVLHFSAADVLRDVETAADSIVRTCASLPPPSSLRAATSPEGGGFDQSD
jgi:very-short-patch-repair endonuclease